MDYIASQQQHYHSIENIQLYKCEYNNLSQYLLKFIGIPKYSNSIIEITDLNDYANRNEINLIILNKRTLGQNIQYKNIETPKNLLNELYNTRKELIVQFNIPSNGPKEKMMIQSEINNINHQITNYNSYNNIESVNENLIQKHRPIFYSHDDSLDFFTTKLGILYIDQKYSKFRVLWYISKNKFQVNEIKSDFTKLDNADGLYKALTEQSKNLSLPKPITKDVYFDLNRPYYMLYNMYKRKEAKFKTKERYRFNFVINKSKKEDIKEILEEYYQLLINRYNKLFSEDLEKFKDFIDSYKDINYVEELPKDYYTYLRNLQINFYRKTSIDLTQNISNTYILEYIENVELLLQELLDFMGLQKQLIKVHRKVSESRKNSLISELVKAIDILNII
jgi:DNA-binding ferritin-like protein (Dps family)